MFGDKKTRVAEPGAIMYTSQCSSGFGEGAVGSSNMSTPSNAYDQTMEDLEKKCFTIDQRLNELETRMVDIFASRVHLATRQRRKVRGTPVEETWADIVACSTTVHGLKEVLTERHPILKLLWVSLFVSAVVAMVLYSITVAKEYLNDPTATQVRIIRQEKYEFPIMLLCPDTWLNASRALSAGLSLGGLKFSLTYLINYGVTPATYTFHSDEEYARAADDFFDWYNNHTNKIANIAEFFKFIALDSEDFVVDYSYANGTLNNSAVSRFHKVIMNEAVCYNLTLDPTEGRVALSELDYLVVSVPDRTMGLLRRQTYWRLFVNPDLSIGMSDTHYVQTFPYHSNTIRIMPRRFKSAAIKSSDCKSTEQAIKQNYTQATCVADCMSAIEEMATLSSPCTPLMFHRSNSIPRNLSGMCQSYPHWPPQRTPVAPLVNTPSHCADGCPPLCDKWIYDCAVESHIILDNDTISELPAGPVADAFTGLRSLTKYYFLNEIIHYGGVLLFEEVFTYSFETMISNFGGQMGLWLGASLMSVIQLLMLVTNFCVERRKRASRAATTRERGAHRPVSVNNDRK